MRRGLWSLLALSLVLVSLTVLTPQTVTPQTATPQTVVAQGRSSEQLALREIYQELVEINTSDSVGDNTRAAEAMAARLRAAGLPADDVQVLAPAPRKGNLVARLRGHGRAQAATAAGPPRCGRGAARGLDHRSVHAASRRTATSTGAASATTRRWPRSSWTR